MDVINKTAFCLTRVHWNWHKYVRWQINKNTKYISKYAYTKRTQNNEKNKGIESNNKIHKSEVYPTGT